MSADRFKGKPLVGPFSRNERSVFRGTLHAREGARYEVRGCPGRRLLIAALGCVFLPDLSPMLRVYGGFSIPYLFTVMTWLAPLIGLWSWFEYKSEKLRKRPACHVGLPAKVFPFAVFVLVIVGVLRGNAPRAILNDVWIYSLFWSFLLLGSIDRVWRDIRNPLGIVVFVGFAAIVGTLGTVAPERIEIAESYTGERGSVLSLGYRLSSVVGCWPLILGFGMVRRSRSGLLGGIAAFLAYELLQIYFMKRAPSLRALAYFISFVVISGSIVKRFSFGRLLAVCVIAGIVVGGFVGFDSSRAIGLKERYAESDWSRVEEAESLLRSLGVLEWTLGAGMGGYFVPDVSLSAGLARVSKDGDLGRSEIHIGALMPLLKGGMSFSILYYSIFLGALLGSYKNARGNEYDAVCLGILPVYCCFLLIEGAASHANPFDAVMVGLLCGRFRSPSSNCASLETVNDVYQVDRVFR